MSKNMLLWGYGFTLSFAVLLGLGQVVNWYFSNGYEDVLVVLLMVDVLAMIFFVAHDSYFSI